MKRSTATGKNRKFVIIILITNIVIILIYDVFLPQEQIYLYTTIKQKKAGKENLRLKYKIILKV